MKCKDQIDQGRKSNQLPPKHKHEIPF